MMDLDYTQQGRRPTVAQIISDWKKGGKPPSFTVTYGETFAEFSQYRTGATMFSAASMRWMDHGNGCRGVQRDKVVAALTAACAT